MHLACYQWKSLLSYLYDKSIGVEHFRIVSVSCHFCFERSSFIQKFGFRLIGTHAHFHRSLSASIITAESVTFPQTLSCFLALNIKFLMNSERNQLLWWYLLSLSQICFQCAVLNNHSIIRATINWPRISFYRYNDVTDICLWTKDQLQFLECFA